jgi:hypothetical protein
MQRTLWESSRVTRLITTGCIHDKLDPFVRADLAGVADIGNKVCGALLNPKPLDICMPVFNAVLAAQYYDVFEALHPPRNLAVYEPCVGASCPVIVAAETYGGAEASYTTINLNKKLREELQAKVAHIKMPVRIIEDNAVAALAHLRPGSFDVACFHHAINDILQTAVSEPRGMDTTAVDWFPNERQMIEWLAEDFNAGLMEHCGRPELMRIVTDAIGLVRPGGYLIFDHFNWCRFLGVDWFPWDLFYNLIPMARGWFVEANLPLTEIHLPGVDQQWWMIFRRAWKKNV